ncbi:hypothetical protein NUW58_g6557 [Xylaria curta]|uniref:Uncharacterized protein n=1 Tax=Xylaria curta TaxID=42375 RepID=A0ACC1NTY0_9PEZI|nr:hypothetical protein NUW58_g6557 [Xylaria curta]
MAPYSDDKAQYAPVSGRDSESVDGEPQLLIVDSLWRRRFYHLFITTVILAVLALGQAAYMINKSYCPSLIPHGVTAPYVPLKLNYVNRVLKEDPDTHRFIGKPRPEMDKAWHDLLNGTLIRFSEEELKLAGNAKSIAHKDGGYVGGLAISHSLHCLKRIKQYIHPEYYYPGEQDWKELDWHFDHCLEAIRQEILCAGSAEVYTLKWMPASDEKPSVTVPQPRMCVDWEALHSWMQGRAALYDDMVKPTHLRPEHSEGSHEKPLFILQLELAAVPRPTTLARFIFRGPWRRNAFAIGTARFPHPVLINQPHRSTVYGRISNDDALPTLVDSTTTFRFLRPDQPPLRPSATPHRPRNMANIRYDTPASLIAGTVVLWVLATAALALRFYSRLWKGQKFITSDWLILVTAIFGTGLTVLELYAIATKALAYPLGQSIEEQTNDVDRLNRSKYVEFNFLLLGVLGIGFLKLSVCFLYWDLFAKHKCRHFIIFWMVVIVIWTAAFFIELFAECRDHFLALFAQPQDYAQHCGASIPAGWALGGTDIATDIVTLLIPVPIILGLNMSRNLKLLTLLTFSIGILTVAASTVKAYIYITATLNRYDDDAILTLTGISIWNLAEVQIGTIAACSPTLRAILVHMMASPSLVNLLSSFRRTTGQAISEHPSHNAKVEGGSEERLGRRSTNGQSDIERDAGASHPGYQLESRVQ